MVHCCGGCASGRRCRLGLINSLTSSSWLVYSNCAAMRRAVADQALCGCTDACGSRAASATAVGLGLYAAASVQSGAARGWIADRQLGNWRLVRYGVRRMRICSCSACVGLVALIWRSMLGWADRRQVGGLRAKVRFYFVEYVRRFYARRGKSLVGGACRLRGCI